MKNYDYYMFLVHLSPSDVRILPSRSLASFTAPSGRPTISIPGIPERRSTSTEIISPSIPRGAWEVMIESMLFLLSRGINQFLKKAAKTGRNKKMIIKEFLKW